MRNLVFLMTTLVFTGCAHVEKQISNDVVEPVKKVTNQYSVKQEVGEDKFVLCEKECDQFSEKELSLVEPLKIEQQVVMQPNEIKIGTKEFRVHFDFGSSRLNVTNKSEISKIKKYIAENHIKQLAILGKTDPVGTQAFNQKLALQRAKQVKQSLIKVSQELELKISTDCCIQDGSRVEARAADVTVLVE